MIQHPFLTRLASDLRAAGGIPIGQVTAVSSGVEPLTIYYRGAIVPGVMKADSYENPQPGDRVVVESWDGVLFVSCSIGATAAPYGPELLPNSGFEFGTVGAAPSGWTDVWGGPVVIDDTQRLSGSSSAKYNAATMTGVVARRLSMIEAVEVDEGVTYRLGAWWLASAVNPLLTCRIRLFTAPTPEGAQPFGAGATEATVAFDNADTTWTEITGPRTIPAGHAYARVFLDVASTATPGSTLIWVDEVTMRQQL